MKRKSFPVCQSLHHGWKWQTREGSTEGVPFILIFIISCPLPAGKTKPSGGSLMNLSLIRSMTRSAVFELENGLCYRPAHPFTVTLNGRNRLRSLPDQRVLPVLPAARYGVHGGCAGRGRKPDLHLYHRGRDLLCGCFPLRSGGRRHHGQHPQAAGGSFHLPQGRHSVRARRPLPHLQPVHEELHHPVP